MVDFLLEFRLQWLVHVKRMEKERGPEKALQFKLDGSKIAGEISDRKKW